MAGHESELGPEDEREHGKPVHRSDEEIFTREDRKSLSMELPETFPGDDENSPEANRRQVGGTHYGLGAFQHWDLVVMFDLDYFQGQITKYVMRWDKKNGVQDLEKAQHFLEKYIEEIKAGRVMKGTNTTAQRD